MSRTKQPRVEAEPGTQAEQHLPLEVSQVLGTVAPEDAEAVRRVISVILSSTTKLEKLRRPDLRTSIPYADMGSLHDALKELLVAVERQPALNIVGSQSVLAIAHNMADGIAALGPALAEVDTPVSPQLARSLAATENAWRALETEFGLLSSREVSELVGSKSPNRSYASEQRSKGKLIAVKRPGGLRYPGYQFDRTEHAIRPVMAELIRIAAAAGRSEASLALWMTLPTGYLDGDRPVDQLSDPDKVVEAAQQSFNVEW